MQNILTATIQQLDNTAQQVLRRQVTVTDSAPTVGEWNVGNLPTTTPTVIALPIAQVRQLVIRNIHASAKMTVTWTPTGGASATVLVLGPSDVVGFWHQTTGTSYGVSALTLQSDTANTPYELYLGG